MVLAELISLAAPPLCWACGAALRGGDALCRGCRARLRWLAREPFAAGPGLAAWAPLAYEGPARALVRALKFQAATGVGETMAAQIVACAPAGLLRDRVLVPVPLDPGRRRRRGFNQAERLTAAIARRTGLPSSACLVRHRGRAPQTGRGRQERAAGLEAAISLRAGSRAPARPLLVDDVITTGATLAACASALHAGGAGEVIAVAYARTPGR